MRWERVLSWYLARLPLCYLSAGFPEPPPLTRRGHYLNIFEAQTTTSLHSQVGRTDSWLTRPTFRTSSHHSAAMTRQLISSKKFPPKPHNCRCCGATNSAHQTHASIGPAVKVPGLIFCSGQTATGKIKQATVGIPTHRTVQVRSAH